MISWSALFGCFGYMALMNWRELRVLFFLMLMFFQGGKWRYPCPSHLRCTPVGHTGRSWACVLGCSGGSGLLQCRWGSLQHRAHTASMQSGRSPQDRHPDTDPQRSTWSHQTYLEEKRKEGSKLWCTKQIFGEQPCWFVCNSIYMIIDFWI